MKTIQFLVLLLAFISAPCDAQVYKCKKLGGGFEITDIPCMDRMELTDDGWKKMEDELLTEEEEKKARSRKRAEAEERKRLRFYSESADGRRMGSIEGREFAYDLKNHGMDIDHTSCLAGSTVGALDLPPGLARTEVSRSAYGASFYEECMSHQLR